MRNWLKKSKLRRFIRFGAPDSLNWKGSVIFGLSRYRTWYDKGISVLAVLRNMELTDLGILMAVAKYMFGEHISTWTIVILGCCYWILNVAVNMTVGWFYEKHNGWEIEAQVVSTRSQPSRVVLVSPNGKPYGFNELAKRLKEES